MLKCEIEGWDSLKIKIPYKSVKSVKSATLYINIISGIPVTSKRQAHAYMHLACLLACLLACCLLKCQNRDAARANFWQRLQGSTAPSSIHDHLFALLIPAAVPLNPSAIIISFHFDSMLCIFPHVMLFLDFMKA